MWLNMNTVNANNWYAAACAKRTIDSVFCDTFVRQNFLPHRADVVTNDDERFVMVCYWSVKTWSRNM